MERTNKGFFVYNEYVKSAYKALTKEQFKDFTMGMVLYGTVGSYPTINPLAEVFLLQIAPLIDKYDRRYTKALKGGVHGGRKPIVTKDKIQNAIQHHGMSTFDELAEYFHCSTRTISRHTTKVEILQYYGKFLQSKSLN